LIVFIGNIKEWVDPKSRFSAPNFYRELLMGNEKSDIGSFADCILKNHPI
jgi:DNA-binding transcriptional regulator/RsmH inhibitor MraZ